MASIILFTPSIQAGPAIEVNSDVLARDAAVKPAPTKNTTIPYSSYVFKGDAGNATFAVNVADNSNDLFIYMVCIHSLS